MQGGSAVDILSDPDEAGQEAATRGAELGEIAEVLSKNIRLPVQLGDAGALNKVKVKELKETLYG